MNGRIRVDDELSIGGQLSPEDIDSLRNQGFRAIVDLRDPSEADMMLWTDEEAEKAERVGVTHVHFPVPIGELPPERIACFLEAFTTLPKPCFVHGHNGRRAMSLALIVRAVEKGWSGEEAILEAHARGVEFEDAEQVVFVRDSIDRYAVAGLT